MSDNLLLTQAAYDRLKDELERLITIERVAIAKKIQEAREEGDLKENGGYHAAKEEQGKIESRINRLEEMLSTAEVGDASAADGVVKQGLMVQCTINGRPQEFYLGSHEVFAGSEYEEQINDGDLDVYSLESPIGQQVLGRRIGDKVSYVAPNGREIQVEITGVSEFDF